MPRCACSARIPGITLAHSHFNWKPLVPWSSDPGPIVRTLDDVFLALAASAFRHRFRLAAPERAELERRGLGATLVHAEDLIAARLAPAAPPNDGKQTPFRGHPVFVAQHATATCCRGCLARWHGIARGAALTDEEQAHVIAVIGRWLRSELGRAAPPARSQ